MYSAAMAEQEKQGEPRRRRAAPKAKPEPKEKTWIRGAKPGERGVAPYVRTEEAAAFVREHACKKGRVWTAIQLGISIDTLRRHYRAEVEAAKADACAQIGVSLFEKALAGDGASQRFFLITQGAGEWSPKVKHEHSGPGGGPIATVDLSEHLKDKDDAELAIIERFLEQLAASGGAGDDAGDLGLPEAG